MWSFGKILQENFSAFVIKCTAPAVPVAPKQSEDKLFLRRRPKVFRKRKKNCM